MGSSEEGVENGGCCNINEESQNKVKPYLVLTIFLSSLLVSFVGSFVLGWWIYKYHPTNSELWMVPLGLILFITPVIVGLSFIISGPTFSNKQQEDDDEVKR